MWFKVKQSLIEDGYDSVIDVEVFVKQIKVDYITSKRIYSCYELTLVLTHLSMICEQSEVDKIEGYIYDMCEYITPDGKVEVIKKEEPKQNNNEQLSLF